MSGNVADDSSEYIFAHAYAPSYLESCASVSDHSIRVLDAALNQTGRLTGHDSAIVALEYAPDHSSCLYSASSNRDKGKGTVAMWDTRAGSGPMRVAQLRSEVSSISLGMGGNLLAVGAGTSVAFYDPRGDMSKALGRYSDCHTDDVTHVAFNEQSPNVLVSGSEDGLMCTFNTAVAAQDDAVVSIINTDGPVRRCGFFGQNQEGLWCLSCTEQASFWHSMSAQRLLSLPNIRQDMQVDYLVDCFQDPSVPVSSDPNAVVLLGGTYNGTGRLWGVRPEGLTPIADLPGGHCAMLRCASVRPAGALGTGSAPVVVTAGEDTRVCRWTLGTAPASVQAPASSVFTGSSGGGRARGGGKQKPDRAYKPY